MWKNITILHKNTKRKETQNTLAVAFCLKNTKYLKVALYT